MFRSQETEARVLFVDGDVTVEAVWESQRAKSASQADRRIIVRRRTERGSRQKGPAIRCTITPAAGHRFVVKREGKFSLFNRAKTFDTAEEAFEYAGTTVMQLIQAEIAREILREDQKEQQRIKRQEAEDLRKEQELKTRQELKETASELDNVLERLTTEAEQDDPYQDPYSDR